MKWTSVLSRLLVCLSRPLLGSSFRHPAEQVIQCCVHSITRVVQRAGSPTLREVRKAAAAKLSCSLCHNRKPPVRSRRTSSTLVSDMLKSSQLALTKCCRRQHPWYVPHVCKCSATGCFCFAVFCASASACLSALRLCGVGREYPEWSHNSTTPEGVLGRKTLLAYVTLTGRTAFAE